MKSSCFLLLALPLCLASCALSPEEKADYATVQHSVSPVLYNKVVHGRPLSIDDLVALTQAQIPSKIILRYLRNHDVVYYLNDDDVKKLEDGGVAKPVIDEVLMDSRVGYWNPGPYPLFGATRYARGHGFYGGYFGGAPYGGFGWGHHP